MQWLIITENQDKAARLREVLRANAAEGNLISATLISSRGLPWTVEVEVSSSELSYKVKQKENYKEVLKKIDEISQESDRVLLAFEPTNIGEATAWEFEKLLGFKKCARFRTYDLDQKTIKDIIVQYESLDTNGLPKANQNMAKAHWAQAVIDLTWASKINEWLSKITNYSAKATRLMGIVLKTIAHYQRKEKRHKSTPHWEMSLELKPSSTITGGSAKREKKLTSKNTIAHIIVPTLAQIGSEVGPKAKEFWEQKLIQSREESIKGWEIPQPEPGMPWRFHQHEEAKIQKQHLKKFPYFVVEGQSTTSQTKEIQCPPTSNNIHDYCAQNQIGTPEEVERVLNALYHNGFITNPKSNHPSLNSNTIYKMFTTCKDSFPNLTQENRVYHSNEDYPNKMEAIHPTNWNIYPKKIRDVVIGSKNLKLNKEEMKRLELIYELIFSWCIKSQLNPDTTTVSRHFLSGPLFLTRKQAQEKEGKSFHIKKEEPFHAHMTVLAMTENGEVPKQGSIMECVEVNIKEVTSKAPYLLNINNLLSLLCGQGAGKRETIINILDFLKEDAALANTKELKLTQKGNEFLHLLELNFGQYLDTNYLKTLNHNLLQIEKGIISDADFLNQWWFSLRNFLYSDKNEPPVLEWKKKH